MRKKFISGSLVVLAAAGALSAWPSSAQSRYGGGYWADDGRYYYSDGSYYDHGRYYGNGYDGDSRYYGNRYDGDRYYGSKYDNGSRYYEGRPVYHGHNQYYYRHRCSGGNGAVGTIGGGVGGALIGNALGGTAGTVLGGVGGALLGRHLDKENTRDQRGC